MAQSQKFILTFLISLFSIILGILAIKTHWADTELWAITISNKLLSSEVDFSLAYKLLFNSILKTIYFFDLNNVQTIHAARFIFWVFGLGILVEVYKIGMLIHGNQKKALFACLVLVTSSFYLSRGFRVRSDLLACFFHLLYLISFLQFNKTNKNLWCVLGFVAVVAMMASTPKAILFFVINMAFIAIFTFVSQKFDQTYKFFTLTVMPCLVGGLGIVMIKSDVFFAAHRYFVNSFHEGFAKPSYFSIKGFYFVLRFLQENPVIVLALLVFIFSSLRIRNVKKKTAEEKAIILTFFMYLGFVVLHNDRLPFFINLMMVVPIVASSWMLFDFIKEVSGNKKMKHLFVFVLLLLFIKGSYYTYRNVSENSNSDQIQSIEYLENYMGQYPGVTYYDGMGALPRSNTIYHFIAPTLGDNRSNTLKLIKDSQPDLIFFSNRMFYFFKPILDQLKETSYLYLGGGVYGKYDSLENLKDNNIYKYQGPFFLKLKPVEGDFDENQKMKVYSRFGPVKLPPGVPFFQVFDFDPRF